MPAARNGHALSHELRGELHSIYETGYGVSSSGVEMPYLAAVALSYARFRGMPDDGDFPVLIDSLLRSAFDRMPKVPRRNTGAGMAELLGIGPSPWRGIEDRRENAAFELDYKNGEALRRSRIKGQFAIHHFFDMAVASIVDIARESGYLRHEYSDIYMHAEQSLAEVMDAIYEELSVVAEHGLPLRPSAVHGLRELSYIGTAHVDANLQTLLEEEVVHEHVEGLIRWAIYEHRRKSRSAYALEMLFRQDKDDEFELHRFNAFDYMQEESYDGRRHDNEDILAREELAIKRLLLELTDWITHIAVQRNYVCGGEESEKREAFRVKHMFVDPTLDTVADNDIPF